jgi:hypothetical protein
VNPNQSGAAQQPDDTLRTFLERRERELTHQIAAVRGELQSKEKELAEIRAVRATLAPSVLTPAVPVPAVLTPVPDTTTFDAAANLIRAKRTIKSMIVSALTSHFDDGATLGEIRTFIMDVFGQEIDRTSISPQLARLRDEGAVEQRGKKWTLSESASQRGIKNNLSPQKSEGTSTKV